MVLGGRACGSSSSWGAAVHNVGHQGEITISPTRGIVLWLQYNHAVLQKYNICWIKATNALFNLRGRWNLLGFVFITFSNTAYCSFFVFFCSTLSHSVLFFFLTHRPSAPLESPLAVYHPLTGLTLEPPLSHAAEGSLVWLLQELRLIPGETPPLLPLFRVVWFLCSLQTRTFPLSQLFIVGIYLSIVSHLIPIPSFFFFFPPCIKAQQQCLKVLNAHIKCHITSRMCCSVYCVLVSEIQRLPASSREGCQLKSNFGIVESLGL